MKDNLKNTVIITEFHILIPQYGWVVYKPFIVVSLIDTIISRRK